MCKFIFAYFVEFYMIIIQVVALPPPLLAPYITQRKLFMLKI